MRIPIDRQSTFPIYRQIEAYLREQIISGGLAPDTRLPATRQLAQDLEVSRITVKNAYAELESDGLISSREGSGTYVMPPFIHPNETGDETDIIWPLWQQALPTIEDIHQNLERSHPPKKQHPDPIDFTGVGDERQFPIKDFQKALRTIIKRDGLQAFVYGEFEGGYPPLRDTITHILGSQGIRARPGNILVTAGSQQALALICQALLKPGDVVLVENPTYNFALELFRMLNLKIIGIPLDEQGMQIASLEPLLQQYHPKLIYTIPNFQNPTGVCLSTSRRRQLVALAERYNVPILEDDFVGDLRYDGRAQPAIKALDPGGWVIYIGTFSKMLMPGLRVGFLMAEGPIFAHLIQLKRVHDLTTSTLMQRILDEYVTVGRYQIHLRRSCRVYRQRRDAMLAAIQRDLPVDVQAMTPQGGLFIWLHLPPETSALDLLPFAQQEGVIYAPGMRFFPKPLEGEGYLRLNFATQPPERIAEGIRRLAKALQKLIAQR